MTQTQVDVAGIIAMVFCLAFLVWRLPGPAAISAFVGSVCFACAFYLA